MDRTVQAIMLRAKAMELKYDARCINEARKDHPRWNHLNHLIRMRTLYADQYERMLKVYGHYV